MSEKPILFSDPMVRAILAGTKTQTRRCHIKPQPPGGTGHWHQSHGVWRNTELAPGQRWKLPYRVNDLLWVRETWRPHEEFDGADMPYLYRADYPEGLKVFWKPSIFMPKIAARLWIQVTGVRVERLQEISEEDCYAEGLTDADRGCLGAGNFGSGEIEEVYEPIQETFRTLWDSLNGKKEGFTWKDNPWIAVYEFTRMP